MTIIDHAFLCKWANTYFPQFYNSVPVRQAVEHVCYVRNKHLIHVWANRWRSGTPLLQQRDYPWRLHVLPQLQPVISKAPMQFSCVFKYLNAFCTLHNFMLTVSLDLFTWRIPTEISFLKTMWKVLFSKVKLLFCCFLHSTMTVGDQSYYRLQTIMT